jgi:hypothetical protein
MALVWALFSLACNHSSERDRLIGYWEGTLPLPAQMEQALVAYDFREDGLTVAVDLGAYRDVTEWPRWEIHSEDQGDLIVHVYRGDEHVYATLVRFVSDDEILLWDVGTERDSTAARVVRRPRPEGGISPAPPPGEPASPGTGAAAGGADEVAP